MTKKEETRVVKRTQKTEMTLLDAIEKVVEASRDSKLSAAAKRRMSAPAKFIAESFGITTVQAILFCICMEKGPRRVDFNDLAIHLNIGNIHVLKYGDDIDALVRRRLLRYRDANDEDCFDVPQPVIKALKHNVAYQLPSRTGLDCFRFFEVLGQLFEDLDDDAITADQLFYELHKLCDDNPQVGFVQQMKLLDPQLEYEEYLLLMLFCHLLVNKDDNDVRFGQMEDIFDCDGIFNSARAELRDDEHVLIRLGLVEHLCEDGIAAPNRFKLTEKARRTLLGEMKLSTAEEKIADVLRVADITAKELFYVEANQRQVNELYSFLEPAKYREIRERMQQTGYRTGFACLFYGGPGTGKTETAYQLAKQTGRDIMVVDVPQIKSKWMGDSEKNIKALFDRYRELVRVCATASPERPAPILLFNEADAIIGIRKQGAQNAVDKMENSIQNIILQEMESLDGIMIATTNLTENLDSAFERRFLYKICFEKPDATVRCRIWQMMLPGLCEADALALASAYDFSGGQIENVSRKATINAILHGEESNDLACLTSYCNAERLEARSNFRKIGF